MKPITDIQQGRENELKALHLIHRFSWLRPQEIGRFIWPGSKHSEIYGVRLGLKLQKAELVIARRLPRHSGTALVLSQSGSARLRDVGINASTGKDIGTKFGDHWIPRKTWEHDLLCTSLLILIKEKKYLDFYSEYEIRAANPRSIKIPDGFICSAKEVYWLEVENTKKSGPNMTEMVKHSLRVARHGEEVFGKDCRHIAFAYPQVSQDTRSYKVNHRLHLVNAIQAQLASNESVAVLLLQVIQKSGAAIDFTSEILKVHSDVLLQKSKQLDLVEQDEDTGAMYFSIDIPYHIAAIEPSGGLFNWSTFIDQNLPSVPEGLVEVNEVGFSKTLAEAKIEIVRIVEAQK